MAKKKNSNIGKTLQTRDEYFEGQGDYRKPGYENRGNYRRAVIVAEHEDMRAVVKLTTRPQGRPLKDEKTSKYKPFVETKDDEGKPIRSGKKFIPNKSKKALSMRDVTQIAIDCFSGEGEQAKRNRNKVREMKGRPKKE